jgi:hypothetical protein
MCTNALQLHSYTVTQEIGGGTLRSTVSQKMANKKQIDPQGGGGTIGGVRTGHMPDRLNRLPLDLFWHSTTD